MMYDLLRPMAISRSGREAMLFRIRTLGSEEQSVGIAMTIGQVMLSFDDAAPWSL